MSEYIPQSKERLTDRIGHKKPLDWDPNERTPYDPFKNSGFTVNRHTADEQVGNTHPFQKTSQEK